MYLANQHQLLSKLPYFITHK